jgi:opacity protein-like surface antigen
MHINVKSYSSDELMEGYEPGKDGRSRLIVALGTGLMFWLGLIGFVFWIAISNSFANGATPSANDPLVMKVYPDGTKVILRWSEVGKSFDNGSTHGGAPKIMAYDPAKDGVVPIGQQQQQEQPQSPKSETTASVMQQPAATAPQPIKNPAPASETSADMPKESGFYVGFEVGGAVVEDIDFSNDQITSALTLNPGIRFDVPIGYRVNEWFSVEFAPGVIYNTLSTWSVTQPVTYTDPEEDITYNVAGNYGIGGSLTQVPLLVNFLLTIPTDSPWEPLIGAGVGTIYSNLSLKDLPGGDLGTSASGSCWSLGYSGLVGLNYHINQDVSLGFNYKFTGTAGQNWNDDLSDISTNTFTQSVEASATFRF